MVLASTSTATARILIGRTGGGRVFQPLVSRLEGEGFNVVEQTSSPVGPRGTLEGVAGVDVVFLVVREADDAGARGPIRPVQRIARDAGLLQAGLGMDRVTLLVEDTVTGLTSDLGVGVLRYPKGSPEQAFEKIRDRAAQLVTRPEAASGLGGRLSRVEQKKSRIAHSLVPLLLLIGLVALLALTAALFLFRPLFGGGGDASASEDQPTVQLIDVTEALRSGSGAADGGTNPDGTAVGGIVAGEDPGGSLAGPSAGFGEANQLFPATCQISLGKGEEIPVEMACAGAGVLVRDGSAGPWHNEARLIALSDGVVAEVVYEAAGTQTIESGVEALDAADAAYGLNSITVTFSAPGQHIHLRDGDGADAREVTLTLRLDR